MPETSTQISNESKQNIWKFKFIQESNQFHLIGYCFSLIELSLSFPPFIELEILSPFLGSNVNV